MNLAIDLFHNPVAVPAQALGYGQGKKRNVSNVVQLARKVTVGDAIHKTDEDHSCGRIFVAHFENKSISEIYVPSKNGIFLWDDAAFLKDGRNSQYYEEISINRLTRKDILVPSFLKTKMETALQNHNEALSQEALQPVLISVGRRVSSGGTDPTGGLFFSVKNTSDDTEREIFLPTDAGRPLWNEASFLREYDKKEYAHEYDFYSLRIKNPENIKDVVSPSLIDKMKKALKDHNKAIQAAALAKLNRQQFTP